MRITGYHGTHGNDADSIKNNGFIPSGEGEWFGSGVYFFETALPITDGVVEAKDWAINVKRFSTWAVVKSEFESEKYFDMIECVEHRLVFDKVKEKAKEAHKRKGLAFSDFDERLVFIRMEEKLNFDLIRVLVDAMGEHSYYAYTIRRPQIQVCVKNMKILTQNSILMKGLRRR